jgi:hypothetical protein
LIVSQIVLDAFHKLKMACSKTTPKRQRELKSIRKSLEKHLFQRGNTGELGKTPHSAKAFGHLISRDDS